MLSLVKLIIYPIKSLDGVEVRQAQVLSSGALN
ncbi:MAG: MOSC N-terminal beta barrel domain-containing protein [Richelia sp.]|nr:MOSC N-terminal beta barrel domain-containing protein [Richelia sp.]